jgi:hypothetical protein
MIKLVSKLLIVTVTTILLSSCDYSLSAYENCIIIFIYHTKDSEKTTIKYVNPRSFNSGLVKKTKVYTWQLEGYSMGDTIKLPLKYELKKQVKHQIQTP